MNAKVEGALQLALDNSANPDELLGVVLSFEAPVTTGAPSLPLTERREQRAQAMSQAIEQALSRAEELTGLQPAQVTSFPLTGSAFVQAPSSYVRVLLDQNGVAGAMLNSSTPNR